MADEHTKRMFAWQHQVLCDPKLSALAKNVASLLLEFVNRKSGDTWVSNGRLATNLGRCRRSIQKAIKQLSEGGHVEVTSRLKSGKTNRIRPLLKEGGANRTSHPPQQ